MVPLALFLPCLVGVTRNPSRVHEHSCFCHLDTVTLYRHNKPPFCTVVLRCTCPFASLLGREHALALSPQCGVFKGNSLQVEGDDLLFLFFLNRLPQFYAIPLFKTVHKCRIFLGLCCSYRDAKSKQVRATPSSGLWTTTLWNRLSTWLSNTRRVASPLLGSLTSCSGQSSTVPTWFQYRVQIWHLPSLHGSNHHHASHFYFSAKACSDFLYWLNVRLIPLASTQLLGQKQN